MQKNDWSLPVAKVREGLTNAEAIETEIALISAIGRKKNGGPLVNLTDGGDGLTGHTHSAEARVKMSKTTKGRGAGRKLPVETTEKMRRTMVEAYASGRRKPAGDWGEAIKANIGRPLSEGHKAKLSASLTPEQRLETGRKVSAANTGKVRGPMSDEWKAKLSATSSGKKKPPRSPEHCEKIRQGKIAWHEKKRQERDLVEAAGGQFLYRTHKRGP
jgi:hypothetical protein